MKRMICVLTIILLATMLASACSSSSEAPVLIYHGQIDRLEIMPERGLWTANAIAITPDGLVPIYSSRIDYCDGESVVTITEWDKWDGDILSITNIEQGEYYLYHLKSGHYLLSIIEISKIDKEWL